MRRERIPATQTPLEESESFRRAPRSKRTFPMSAEGGEGISQCLAFLVDVPLRGTEASVFGELRREVDTGGLPWYFSRDSAAVRYG